MASEPQSPAPAASQPGAPERDPEILQLFIEESVEALERVEALLLKLEGGQTVAGGVDTLFRDMHTIKGTAGHLQFVKVQALAHAAEDFLSCLRTTGSQLIPEHVAHLVAATDSLRALVARIQGHSDEEGLDVGPMVQRLEAATLCPLTPVDALRPEPQPAAAAAAAPAALEPMPGAEGGPAADTAVRVNVAILDHLINITGELVLARNQLFQNLLGLALEDTHVQESCHRLSHVTSDLQEMVMRTRMQPISRVFDKIPRAVRDLAHEVGKKVNVQIAGTTTEVDKALVDSIRDPILHIIRNAIDHGIEPEAARKAAGKPAVGVLSVRAAHQGGMVVITVRDDGAGIDPNKMRTHALHKGYISEAEAHAMSDRQAIDLIFRPGFSTAERVTHISGRGVGMDVVRTYIERAGGQVEVMSVVGQETTLQLKLPLTLAIIPALLVGNGGKRFAIPQTNLLELIYLSEETARTAIERVREVPVYRRRGEVLPLLSLTELLDQRGHPPPAGEKNIVVLNAGGRPYGLVVDKVLGTEDIVIKALEGSFKKIECYSGATVLGDGGVALILDAMGLAKRSGIVGMVDKKSAGDEAPADAGARQPYLVFEVGQGQRCAVPLATVERLENIEQHDIERNCAAEFVQYRGEVLPIVRAESVLPATSGPNGASGQAAAEGQQVVIVFNFGHRVALAVNHIVDIVDAPADFQGETRAQDFALGQLILVDRVTLILDAFMLCMRLAPGYVKERRRSRRAMRVVLADRSGPLRAANAVYLRACGIQVVDVDSAEALVQATSAGAYDAAVADLELLESSNFAALRALKRLRPELGVFAWTAERRAQDVERARGAGVSGCIDKYQREALSAALAGFYDGPDASEATS